MSPQEQHPPHTDYPIHSPPPPQAVAAPPSSQTLGFVSEPSGMHRYAKHVPTEGAHGQIAISRPHVGLLLVLKTAHSATAGN